jgi:hypothetical protein
VEGREGSLSRDALSHNCTRSRRRSLPTTTVSPPSRPSLWSASPSRSRLPRPREMVRTRRRRNTVYRSVNTPTPPRSLFRLTRPPLTTPFPPLPSQEDAPVAWSKLEQGGAPPSKRSGHTLTMLGGTGYMFAGASEGEGGRRVASPCRASARRWRGLPRRAPRRQWAACLRHLPHGRRAHRGVPRARGALASSPNPTAQRHLCAVVPRARALRSLTLCSPAPLSTRRH